jgi:hypothetical protein
MQPSDTRPEYEASATWVYDAERAGDPPSAYLAAAKAAEAMGDTNAAIEAPNRFLQLWSYADADLQPRLEAARNALSRLTRSTW